jgi:hypothetical protein
MGIFGKVFPGLAKHFQGNVEMAIEGLTGVPSLAEMEKLMQHSDDEDDDDDSEYSGESEHETPTGTAVPLSQEAVHVMQRFNEAEYKLLNRLIVQIGNLEPAEERMKLLHLACNFLGKMAPETSPKPMQQPPASEHSAQQNHRQFKGFKVRRPESSDYANEQELPPQQSVQPQADHADSEPSNPNYWLDVSSEYDQQ